MSFLTNLHKLYNDGDNLDIEVHVGDRTFRALRFILCTHSPVFEAMLSHDTIENQTNTIKIVGFDADVVESFLDFLHLGTLNPECDALKMLYIADYYDMTVLKVKNICFKIMDIAV